MIRPHFAKHTYENCTENREEDPEDNREEKREENQNENLEENPEEEKKEGKPEVVKKHLVTSSVVLGRRVNIVVDGKGLRLEKDRQRDYIRHQSIELGKPPSSTSSVKLSD